jgi:hypothetical protein
MSMSSAGPALKPEFAAFVERQGDARLAERANSAGQKLKD